MDKSSPNNKRGAQDPCRAVLLWLSVSDFRDPFFHTLVPVLAEQMADAFS